ncbi:MAG: Flp pilus assembly complex ATPase component TadA [Planctomycetes bacterium]|nr:Flp pilus assembly complex ATPase component TadA [Planctomycetota bacterium]
MSIRIGDLLVNNGLITKYQLEVALQEQQVAEIRYQLGRQLVVMDFVTKHELSEVLSEHYECTFIDAEDLEKIPDEIIAKMPFDKCDEFRAVPFKEVDGVLYVAMQDPVNITLTDDIRFVVNMPIEPVLADIADIGDAIEKYHGAKLGGLNSIMDDLTDSTVETFDEMEKSGDLMQMADSRPVIKLLNHVLKAGIEHEASDVHFEPYEDGFRVRYRVDGVLYEMEAPPPQMAAALIARIKIISKLNISETRLPQDGRIALTIAGRPVDLRVSTIPTKFGESAVLRILDKGVVSLDLHNLRMSDHELTVFDRVIKKPSGVVLVTGPTGSGKTTTLYACLNEINKEDVKIITNEDPVEYNIDGLIQVPINPTQGLTFGKSLRASLRQDPDVILVGEIRDKETAEIAVESSLTGHLVFSTLHTNDAPSSITRLVDMGIDAFLVAATVEAIIAQRLVRTICPACKVPYTPSQESLMQLGIDPATIPGDVTFYRGEGCDECRHTRYRGRVALYEILELNNTLRELVLKHSSIQELTEKALEMGMIPLRQVGIQKIFDGITTIEEVVHATVTMD